MTEICPTTKSLHQYIMLQTRYHSMTSRFKPTAVQSHSCDNKKVMNEQHKKHKSAIWCWLWYWWWLRRRREIIIFVCELCNKNHKNNGNMQIRHGAEQPDNQSIYFLAKKSTTLTTKIIKNYYNLWVFGVKRLSIVLILNGQILIHNPLVG
jgi:hypothetical protein